MGAKLSLANSTSWERIHRTKDPPGKEKTTKKAIHAQLAKEPGAALVSESWRCGAAAITQCPEEGSYRIIAGSREESGRTAFQVKVWDVANVRPVLYGALEEDLTPPPGISLRFSLGGHTGPVSCAAIAENGLVGATAGDDLGIIVWDLKRGKLRVRVEAHTKQVKCVALTHNGNWGISCSWDKSVKFWDLFKGKCLRTAEGYTRPDTLGKIPKRKKKEDQEDEDGRGHSEGVQSCDLRVTTHPGEAAGGLGVTSSWDGAVKIWDLAGMTVLRTLRGHVGCVWSCRMCTDAKTVVSCGADKTVRVWNCEVGECMSVMEGHQKDAIACSVRGDGAVVATASWDMSVRLWDVRKGECRRSAQIGLDRPCCVSLSPDGLVVVAAHEDDTISIMVCMQRIVVKVKIPEEARRGAADQDNDGSPAKKSDPQPLSLHLDPDDGFYALCEALHRHLCDRDRVSASHQYCELPPRFQRFNWAKVRVAQTDSADAGAQANAKGTVDSVAPIGKGGKTFQIPSTAASDATSRAGGASLTGAGSTWDNGRRVTVGTGEKPKPAKPAFTFEENWRHSLRELGFKHGSELQLLKPIDAFEEKSADEIKALGHELSNNLWWEKQEKAAALLLKEYADHKTEMRHQRKAKREVKFAASGAAAAAGDILPGAAAAEKVDLLGALSKQKQVESVPVAPIEMYGKSFAMPGRY